MKLLKSDKRSVDFCVECLKNNKVIIIPTDTVYGFSAVVNLNTDKDEFPMNDNSTFINLTDEKIRKIKGRQETKPFIQLIAKPSDIYKYTDDVIPEKVLKLWPGPLTIIVHDKKTNLTTAYRCPKDKWLCQIIEKLGKPIYSTSVNRSGQKTLDKILDIEKEFDSEVELIIDDGDKTGNVASTIISIENNKIKVIRQGAITIE